MKISGIFLIAAWPKIWGYN